jgi:16S rRNA U516 pseudouridylate synthase RsuA-like enzyme
LIRTAYGPFELADLPAGSVEEVRPETLKAGLKNYFAQA